ncbi:hypothetical protein ACQ4PT_058315 [Festuca glaucescens]
MVGLSLTHRDGGSRWEALKKDYNCWKSLNQHASGLGRDPITNSIAASDDWWDNEIKRCAEASKFRYAPLADEDKMREIFEQHSVTNEYARVPVPSSQVGTSHINVLNDDDSGCEEVTPTQVPGKGGKKRACPYSPSPTLVEKVAKVDEEKGAFTHMVDLFAKREEKRNSVPSEPIVIVDPVKVEFKEMMTMVVKAGGLPGSDERFYASQMFMKKEYRDAFGCSCFEDAEPSTILGWINRTWGMFMKNK